jgi:hypothetical protein
MQKHIASRLAVMGMAAVVILPSAYLAQARSYRYERTERPALSASQSVDHADARLANLKADLRLTADQAKNWSGFETAFHDVATKRAKTLAEERNPQSGRSASESTVSPAASEDADFATRRERDARVYPQQDDITALQREADSLGAQSASLKQIADAAKPLYDSLDNRQRARLVHFVHADVRATQEEDWRGLRR